MYRKHASAVLGYLRGRGLEDPENVLGDVFLHVARSLNRFRGSDEDLRRWVFTIARNRAIDDHRRRSRRPRLSGTDLPDRATQPPEEGVDQELLGALGQLTADQREVIALRFIADLSLDHVAKLTGRSLGAVKSMQLRGLAQLTRILGEPTSAVSDDG